MFAAVSAARTGARVLLLERSGSLGGTAALGEPLRGFPLRLTKLQEDFLEILRELNGVREASDGVYAVNGETLKLAFHRLCRENRVEMLLYSEACRLQIRDGVVTGLSAVGKNAMLEIETSVAIDATGTGDLARSAGVLTQDSGGEAWGAMILTGLYSGRLLDRNPGGIWKEGFDRELPGTEYFGPLFSGGSTCRVSICLEPHRYLVQFPVAGIASPGEAAARAEGISATHIQALDLLRSLRGQPGFEEVRLSQMPTQLKLYGACKVQGLEQAESCTFDRAAADMCREDGRPFCIGLEHLIPSRPEGLLVCGGLTLSGMVDRPAYSRGISLVTGEAAGVCAGLAVKKGCGLREVDIGEMQLFV